MKASRQTLPVFLVCCGLAAPAWAYIDPSAGSYLLQILAAGFFAAMFALKMFWHRLKSLFGRHRPAREPGNGEPDERGADSAS